MDSTLVTLEDRDLSAVRGGWGHGGWGHGGWGFGYRHFHRFGWGGFGGGLDLDDDCGVETDFDMRSGVGCYGGFGSHSGCWGA